LYGRVRLAAIRKNFTKGKVASILGREPDAQFFSSHAMKFSVTVEEGNYTTTQRQTELQQMLHFRELGMPISDERIMSKAFIADKQEIIQEMQQQKQMEAQAQQMQAEQEQKAQNAEIMTKYAKAQADMAKKDDLLASAQGRFAKMQDDLANAEHRETEADLNLVEQMIKLEDMDLANFRASLELAEAVKLKNEQMAQEDTYA
jgi:hypothetical protein